MMGCLQYPSCMKNPVLVIPTSGYSKLAAYHPGDRHGKLIWPPFNLSDDDINNYLVGTLDSNNCICPSFNSSN